MIEIVATLTVAFGLLACGPDLGDCDVEAITAEIDDATSPFVAVSAGQVVIQSSCGGGAGARCHDEGAVGAVREGAPAELDFNTYYDAAGDPSAEAQRAYDNVKEWAEAMWAEIDGGTMPPGGELGSADKEAARNWMACVASGELDKLAGEGALAAQPARTQAREVDSDNGLASAMPVLAVTCAPCHNDAAASGGFSMGPTGSSADPCLAYSGITGRAGLIVPNDPQGSFLIGLLDGTQGSSTMGASMPPGRPLMGESPETYQQLVDWIAQGALAPPGCQ